MSTSTTVSTLAKLQELLPQLFQAKQLPGNSYLRCELTPELSVLISMDCLQESLLVSKEQITPIPNLPEFVVGLMNSRDQVFCVIDLAQLLGLSSAAIYTQQTYHLLVVRVSPSLAQRSSSEQELLLGFIVNQVQGLTRIASEEMQPPPEKIPPSLIPYLHGCLIDKRQQLPVVDIESVIKQVL